MCVQLVRVGGEGAANDVIIDNEKGDSFGEIGRWGGIVQHITEPEIGTQDGKGHFDLTGSTDLSEKHVGQTHCEVMIAMQEI